MAKGGKKSSSSSNVPGMQIKNSRQGWIRSGKNAGAGTQGMPLKGK